MNDFDQNYQLWNEFLQVWPPERLATMTLDEYTKASSKDSFTYWIESSLDKLGSIWGGSSFKFGVYSRDNTEEKESSTKLSYSGSYGWYTSLGKTPEEAFEKVKNSICKVAEYARAGNLDDIENLTGLGEAYKWKIAFHYQDQNDPKIVNIFKQAPLKIFVGEDSNGHGMANLQEEALAKRPSELGILEFGHQIWEEWSQKNLVIWKLSHGGNNFSEEERQKCLANKVGAIGADSSKGQAQNFSEAPVGTLFYLCHGNSPILIGQFTSKVETYSEADDWLQRSYRVLKKAVKSDPYQENSKYWSPRGNSTFYPVPALDLLEFEKTLLTPYYEINLAELAKMAGGPIELVDADDKAENNIIFPNISELLSPKNIIFYGPPGTGKTFGLQNMLKNEYTDSENGIRYTFVTFHQSYGYEEFVEGLRPVISKRDKVKSAQANSEVNSDGQIHYEIKPGAFLKLCKQACKNPAYQYAIVIDEINRGNISKIFGELITLIELDKRAGSTNSITVTLPYSGDFFSVPANVDIIGTMNTADRSLALVDTALRRRFEFIEIMPKPELLIDMKVSANSVEIDLVQLLTKINQRIEALYDREHTIGHAYFMQLQGLPDNERFGALTTIFKNRIIPLLEEYFFEDWQKIRLVLGDNQKTNPDHQFVTETSNDKDLQTLFGTDHELDQYEIRSRYQLNVKALDQAESYHGIYAPKANTVNS